MPTISYILRSKKKIAPVSVRFVDGRSIDFLAKTTILVSGWNQKKQKCDSDTTNAILLKLKSTILEQYNLAVSQGRPIDKYWLEKIVSFDKQTKPIPNNFIDFCNYWLENNNWKTPKNKPPSETVKNQYKAFIDLFSGFDKRIYIQDVNQSVVANFVSYLEDLDYEGSTIKRNTSRIKFFLQRAKELGKEINHIGKVYIESNQEANIYLNENEIQKIFDLKCSDQTEDACRDNLIISCYTGLRISDLMSNLDIQNGFIAVKTKKTGQIVKIPIHPKVKAILNKRFGMLPTKVSDKTYNLVIKKICKRAGINEIVFGKVWDDKKKRKVSGNYPKWKLITSHVGRKSIATNLSGKIPKEVIASVAGWASTKMVDYYNKTTQEEYAKELAEYWNKN